MKIEHSAIGKIALAASIAAALAACQSNKPEPVAPPVQQQQPPAQQQPQRPTPPAAQPPVSQTPIGAPTPGSVRDFVINVGERVFFDLNSYDIRADARPVLDAQAAWLARYPAVTVRIEGNADERGTREYNFALGERRANSVRDYLVSRGVSGNRISVVSYGKERPIAEGSNEAAWAQNRNGRTAIVGGAPQQ